MYVLNLNILFFWLSKIEVDCKYVIKRDIRKCCFFCKNYLVDFYENIFLGM